MWSVPLTLVLHGIRVNNADGKGDNGKIHHQQTSDLLPMLDLVQRKQRMMVKFVNKARRKRVTLE